MQQQHSWHQVPEEWQWQWLAKTSVGILSLLPTVLLLPHIKACATGNTSFFLKQLIVFISELNEKDHKTVFITDGSQDWRSSSRHLQKCRGEWVHIPHEGQPAEETWRAQGQEGHSGVNCLDFLLLQITQRSTKLELRSSRTCSQKMPTTSWQRHTVWVTGLLHNSSMTTIKYYHCIQLVCESLHSVYTRRHFKEAILCHFMCSVYNNYTVNLLCSRRDKISSNNKPANGTVLTQKGLRCTRRRSKRVVRTAVQGRSKVGNECLVQERTPGNKQAMKVDKMTCSCECCRCLCHISLCPVCDCAKEDDVLMFLSILYGAEGYKESYSFTDSDSPIHYTRGTMVTDLCEWEMSVPAWENETKGWNGVGEGGTTLTITSRRRKKKVNLPKKVVKDEMKWKEKKYFGKEEK